MSILALYFMCLWFVLCLVRAQHDATNSSCDAVFRYLNSNTPVNISQACNQGECVVKCCPERQILLKEGTSSTSRTICVDILDLTRDYKVTGLDDFSKAVVYRDNVKRKIIRSGKKISDFIFIFSEMFADSDCMIFELLDFFTEPQNLIYLTENGQLSIRRVNFVDQWFRDVVAGEFCVDNRLELDNNGTLLSPTPTIAYRAVYSTDEETTMGYAKLTVYGMLISCFFMVLVLIVYALLPELRNLAGLMLMAYVATLTAAFLSRTVQVLANANDVFTTTECAIVGLVFIYTILSSFSWMNVMSFDIWWSMRGFRKVRRIHRRGTLVKFCWYCLYGWGTPLVPTLFIIIVENLDLTHLPNFVKPHLIYPEGSTCFFNEDERQLFVNAPILIMTVTNIVLFLMTAYNIWRIKTGVTQYSAGDSKRNNEDRHRFSLYLKLSLVMGISWVLEVVSSLVYSKSPVWIIFDAYNVLIGFFIFFIFVFKRKIFVLLCRRFSIENKWATKWQRTVGSAKAVSAKDNKKKMVDSVTESSDSGEPTSTSKVSYNYN